MLSLAVVVPWIRRGRTCDTRNGTQILINGAQVTVSHVLEIEPWHDLQKTAVEWKRHAPWVDGTRRTGGMEMVHVDSSPHDLHKLGKRVAPFRQSGFIRGQIAGENMRRAWDRRTEIPAATQISRRINPLRLAKEWVTARKILVVARAPIVANIAVAWPVYEVTT